jgi:ribose-phosphate pyrophosphokinase
MQSSKTYALEIADYLDVKLAEHVEKSFVDKELYIRADENVRACDCYIIQSLFSDSKESVNDKFTKLLIFIRSLKDASATRVTAVFPYLAYLRQDRKTESRAPVTTKYLAQILEAVGCDRILAMDVHNLSAFQCAFRIPTDTLEAKNLFVDYVAEQLKTETKEIVVLNPDAGGVGRSDRFAKALCIRLKKDVPVVYLNKIREDGHVKGNRIVGDIKDKLVLAIDDMISSGSTLAKCYEATMAAGGELWGVCVTHGLFVDNAVANLAKLNRIIVTDTIGPPPADLKSKLTIISTSKIFAKAIRRIHDEGGSISDLLK